MKTTEFILTLLVVMGFYSVGWAQNHGHGHDHNAIKATEIQDHSIYHTMAEWTDHRGDVYELNDFKGNPLIVVMFYGNCVDVCPILIQDAWRLFREIDQSNKEHVRVLAVTFDPDNDSPAVLHAYADAQQLNIPGWHFMTGNRSGIRELAMMLGVEFRQTGNGNFEHSNLVTVIDTEGVVVERIEGLGQPVEEAGKLLNELVKTMEMQ
ncbi:MAG: SCO family protein [Balneolales bacterium]